MDDLLKKLAERLRSAEARVENARRAIDLANDEMRRARRELIAADKAYTKAQLRDALRSSVTVRGE